jgi:hypothetical protein
MMEGELLMNRRSFLSLLLVSVLFTAPILACNRRNGGSSNPTPAGVSQDAQGDELDRSLQTLDDDMANTDTLEDVPGQ